MAGAVSAGTTQWSSRFAFIMAAVGSSVGLGNLWRFSAEAGSNGGGAFIIIYLACVIFIGIPVLMSEFIIGRAGNASSAIRSIDDIAEKSGVSGGWSVLGVTGMAASFMIVSFYCVVAAWVIVYIPKFLSGSFTGQSATQIAEQFGHMVETPEKITDAPKNVLLAFTGFAMLTTFLVARGVNKGIEMASKILMPIFFVLLIALSLYSLVSGFGTEVMADGKKTNGSAEALKFLFAPDFGAITPKVATAALGQAFFSIGLGSAIMITYGSYLPKTISIPKSAIIIGLTDTAVALIAGLAIFPIVFSHGLDFSAGAGIFFQTLPVALSSAPGGNFIGAAFFFLAIFAAVTSSISLLEPTVAWVAEKFKLRRVVAASIAGFVMWLLGFGSIYLAGFMDVIDGELTGAVMLPLTGLLTILFVGWRMKKAMVNEQMHGVSPGLRKLMIVLVRFVAPFFVGIVLLAGIWDKYFAGRTGADIMEAWDFRRLVILALFIVVALVWSRTKNRESQ
ncbi:MAG: sodium-dependent transporter [Robiginitomaculum sp.]|nr:sodium-dependent transporter [Robiginitomaculum sp.]